MRRALAVAAVLAAVLAGCGDDGPPECEAGGDLTSVATGAPPLRELSVGMRDGVLVVEVDADSGTPNVLLDLDDDRDTGMWSLQSPISSSGWDVLVTPDGVLRHNGLPTEWAWSNVDADDDGTGWSENEASVLACVGTATMSSVPANGVVRVSAILDDTSLPATFLPGAPWPGGFASAGEADEPVLAAAPQSLAFGYGFRPWEVGGCTTPACAVARYGQFDHVVLGSGMEEAEHPSHDGAVQLLGGIRAASPDTEVWGYVSLVGGPVANGRRTRAHSVDDIAARAAAWKAIGVTGIFLDEADLCRPEAQTCSTGPDGDEIGVTRRHQNAAVDAIHELGLPVFANGFAPHDVIGVADGAASTMGGAEAGRAADVYLLENPTFAGGRPSQGVDELASRARYETARQLTSSSGIRLAAVDTWADGVADGDRRDPRWTEVRAAVPAATIHGISNESYSEAPLP